MDNDATGKDVMASQKRSAAEQPAAADVRSRILHAALDVFSELGFERASTRKIATAAGMEQGHVAYYFPAKEKLWREVLKTFNRECEELLHRHITATTLRWPVENARTVLPLFLRFFHDHASLTRLMLQEFSHASSRHDWVVETFGAPIWRRLAPVFEGLETAGLLAGASAEVAYFDMVGAALLVFGSGAEIENIAGVRPRGSPTADDYIAHMLVPVFLERSRCLGL